MGQIAASCGDGWMVVMEALNTYRGGPDEQGHFGMFGGRYVAAICPIPPKAAMPCGFADTPRAFRLPSTRDRR